MKKVLKKRYDLSGRKWKLLSKRRLATDHFKVDSGHFKVNGGHFKVDAAYFEVGCDHDKVDCENFAVGMTTCKWTRVSVRRSPPDPDYDILSPSTFVQP